MSQMAATVAQSLALPAIVDLDALDGVRDQLVAALENGPVTIDASAVERVATNALVMLLSAAETAKRSDHAFAVSGISDPMTAAIERLGMTEVFEPLVKGYSQ